MGMFDSVIHRCKCGNDVEWQSKADECVLAVYKTTEVPVTIANDINGEEQKCQECGTTYKLLGCDLPQKISMIIQEV